MDRIKRYRLELELENAMDDMHARVQAGDSDDLLVEAVIVAVRYLRALGRIA